MGSGFRRSHEGGVTAEGGGPTPSPSGNLTTPPLGPGRVEPGKGRCQPTSTPVDTLTLPEPDLYPSLPGSDGFETPELTRGYDTPCDLTQGEGRDERTVPLPVPTLSLEGVGS